MTIHPIIDQPFCRVCDDYYYLIDEHGKKQVCPACSCRHCKRLKYLHEDLGGCICTNRNGNGRTKRRRPLAAAKETDHA